MFTLVNFMLCEIHLNFSNPKIKSLSKKNLLEKMRSSKATTDPWLNKNKYNWFTIVISITRLAAANDYGLRLNPKRFANSYFLSSVRVIFIIWR